MVSYSGGVEAVFRALADPTRRALLDALYERDGQTLVALTARHDLTRVGVAKHLRLLEEAGLVVTKRRGREKLHYLNPVPIRLVHDRWVSKYTEPWAAGLTGLKSRTGAGDGEGLRDLHPHHPGTPVGGDHRSGDPGQVPLRRRRRVDWTPGSPYALVHPASDRPLAEGENLVVEPPAPARPDHAHAVERGRRAGRHLPGDLGDRSGRRLVPADRHPRPAPRRRPAGALRRLADDLVRPEDLAGDRPDPDHPRLADVRREPTNHKEQ